MVALSSMDYSEPSLGFFVSHRRNKKPRQVFVFSYDATKLEEVLDGFDRRTRCLKVLGIHLRGG
jgi:hypothetical protein